MRGGDCGERNVRKGLWGNDARRGMREEDYGERDAGSG